MAVPLFPSGDEVELRDTLCWQYTDTCVGNSSGFHCTMRYVLKKRAEELFSFEIIRDSLENSDKMRHERLEIMRYAILCVETQILSLKKTVDV